MIKVLICSLGLTLMVAACGKKDDGDTGDKGVPAAKDTPAEASGAPDKSAVTALDCTKACTVQFDCARKNGMLHPEAKLSDCEQGCSMLKSMYDPAKHDIAAKRFLSYAAGNCD